MEQKDQQHEVDTSTHSDRSNTAPAGEPVNITMPVLNNLVDHFKTLYGNDFAKMPHRSDTLFVIVQHGFVSIRPMMDALLGFGISPEQVFLTTKPHTTPKSMQTYFENIFGENYVPFHWDGAENYDYNSGKHPYRVLSEKTCSDLLNAISRHLFHHPKSAHIKNIVICDEGGRFLSKFIKLCHNKKSKTGRKFRALNIVAVEHTRCGTRQEDLINLFFAYINMAESFPKLTLESQLISNSMFRALGEKFREMLSKQENPCIGVIGCGAVGEQVLGYLLEHYPQVRLIAYDKVAGKVVGIKQRHAEDDTRWERLENKEDLKGLLKDATIVLGCSGCDILKGLSINAITNDKPETRLISFGSGINEFESVLVQKKVVFEGVADIHDLSFIDDKSQSLVIHNAGFPVNFSLREDAGLLIEEAQLPRTLKLAAIVQAMVLLQRSPSLSHHLEANSWLEGYVKLAWQLEITHWYGQHLPEGVDYDIDLTTITQAYIDQHADKVGVAMPTEKQMREACFRYFENAHGRQAGLGRALKKVMQSYDAQLSGFKKALDSYLETEVVDQISGQDYDSVAQDMSYLESRQQEGEATPASCSLDATMNVFLEGDEKLLLLLGEPGSGKSLFAWSQTQKLYQAQLNDVANSRWLPIVIDLKHYRLSQLGNLLSLYLTRPRESESVAQGYGLYPEELLALQGNGQRSGYRLLVILDGFDELRQEEVLNRASTEEAFHDCFKTCLRDNPAAPWHNDQVKLVVTCRQGHLADLVEKRYFGYGDQQTYMRRVLLPLKESQVIQYVKNHLKPDQSRDCLADIKALPEVKKRVSNPFNLVSFVQAFPTLKPIRNSISERERVYVTFFDNNVRKREARRLQTKNSSTNIIRNDWHDVVRRMLPRRHLSVWHMLLFVSLFPVTILLFLLYLYRQQQYINVVISNNNNANINVSLTTSARTDFFRQDKASVDLGFGISKSFYNLYQDTITGLYPQGIYQELTSSSNESIVVAGQFSLERSKLYNVPAVKYDDWLVSTDFSDQENVNIHDVSRKSRSQLLNSIAQDFEKSTASSHDHIVVDAYNYRVLNGGGGVGKTLLAKQYAAMQKQKKDYYQLIRWIDASDNLESQFSLFLSEVFHVEEHFFIERRAKLDVVASVYASLSRVDRWLLIFDNVENKRVLENYRPEHYKKHLGDGIAGSRQHCLITSRHPKWPGNHRTRVGGFTFPEVEAYARRFFDEEDYSQQDLVLLAEEFEFHPLSIVGVIHYLDNYRQAYDETLTIERYLSWLVDMPIPIRSDKYPDPSEYGSQRYSESTLKSISLSLQLIVKTCDYTEYGVSKQVSQALVQHILKSLSYLQRNDVPVEIISVFIDIMTDVTQEQLSKIRSEVLDDLLNFQIIDYDERQEKIIVHQIVQYGLQFKEFEDEGESLIYLLKVFNQKFNYDPDVITTMENYDCQRWLRHVTALLKSPIWALSNEPLSQEIILLYVKIGQYYLFEQRNHLFAYQWLSSAESMLEANQSLFPSDIHRQLLAKVYGSLALAGSFDQISIINYQEKFQHIDDENEFNAYRMFIQLRLLMANFELNDHDIASQGYLQDWKKRCAEISNSSKNLTDISKSSIAIKNEREFLRECQEAKHLFESKLETRVEHGFLKNTIQIYANYIFKTKDEIIDTLENYLNEIYTKKMFNKLVNVHLYFIVCETYIDKLLSLQKNSRAEKAIQKMMKVLSQYPASNSIYNFLLSRFQVQLFHRFGGIQKIKKHAQQSMVTISNKTLEAIEYRYEYRKILLKHRQYSEAKKIHSEIKQLLVKNDHLLHEQLVANMQLRAIHLSVLFNDIEITKWLIEKGVDPNSANNTTGDSPLIIAAGKGNMPIVQLLIDANASINQVDRMGFTPLITSIIPESSEVTKLLLFRGAEVNIAHNGFYFPLGMAAYLGDIVKCQLLIDHGAEVNFSGFMKRTALHNAASEGQRLAAEFLLDRGAKIDCVDVFGATPLLIAVRSNRTDVCKLLIDREAAIEHPMLEGETLLIVAAVNGYTDICQTLIDGGADIDQPNKKGATPLYAASESGRIDTCQMLLDRGADVDHPVVEGATPLFIASERGHLEICQLLVDKGATIDKPMTDGATPLLIAAQFGHFNICQLLIEGGATIDQAAKDGLTPLRIAAERGHVNVSRLLLDRGAAVDQGMKDGSTPLFIAAQFGHTDVCRLLLDRGAAVDQGMKDGLTPLLLAARFGYTDVCELFLDRGATVDQPMENGATPLLIAAELGHVNISHLLLDRGAAVDQGMKDGLTPLLLAARFGHTDVCELLLDRGATIDQPMVIGVTPLRIAAERGHVNISRLLLDRGAAVDRAAKDGATPLRIAAQLGHLNVSRLLLDRGAAVDQSMNDGSTPLLVAAQFGHTDVCELLLDRGATIDQPAVNGVTPMFIAAYKGHMAVCQLLIDRGVDIHHLIKDGQTSLWAAARNGHKDICQLLLANKATVDGQDKDGATALYVAASNGHTEVARLLLANHAAVNQVKNNGLTPLNGAADSGYVDTCQLLLENGAAVDQAENDGWTPLHHAASKRHLEVSQLLMANNASVDQPTKVGATPLYIAAQNGHAEVCEFLLVKGASVDQQDKDGVTPLYVAARYGHTEVARLLLANGAAINHAETNGWTPLNSAADGGYVDTCQLLLANNASVNQSNKNGVTPLYVVAQNGHVEVCRLLLAKNASVDQSRHDGWAPLHAASDNNRLKVCKLLLAKGASVDQQNKNGVTPLYVAAQNGHAEVCEFLLAKGASVDQQDKDGVTPLYVAARYGHTEVARLLLTNGADVNHAETNGWTPLNSAADGGHVDTCRLLLDNSADINQAENNGWAPLNVAGLRGHTEVVRLLLVYNATVDKLNSNGVSTLYIAAKNGHIEICRLLLDKGSAVDHQDKNGATPLHLAVEKNHIELCQLLLVNGAIVDQARSDGSTPLMIAAGMGYIEVCRLLLDSGAKVNHALDDGRTALMLAKQKGHFAVCHLLIEYGADVSVGVLNELCQPGELLEDPKQEKMCNLLQSKLRAENDVGQTTLYKKVSLFGDVESEERLQDENLRKAVFLNIHQ